ncbi:hypothetical protein [Psychrobacter sp. FDAARGOS_221]|uniref:hypothetical protein n=1 Tax=Psychrobacter sp. FDAARGOS_221 TaxID=1975705 RepID=UPI000BB52FB5|nr:hypothetical protein [Psychrobacter sp. FDAARGOS_221]PNK60115.1 hypothetical protein A6J60_003995 [Psychrobacter sp. FDAARGOS_221]
MNRFSKTLSYLFISSAIILSGCQSMAEPTNMSSDNYGNQQDSKNTAQHDLEIMAPIIKKYRGEIVGLSNDFKTNRLDVDVCFYKQVSADLKSDIEQELTEAIGKSVVVTPSSHLTLPIGGLDESTYQHDPCVY